VSRIIEMKIDTVVLHDFPADVGGQVGRALESQLLAALTELRDAGGLPRTDASIRAMQLRFESASPRDSASLATGAARAVVDGIRR